MSKTALISNTPICMQESKRSEKWGSCEWLVCLSLFFTLWVRQCFANDFF